MSRRGAKGGTSGRAVLEPGELGQIEDAQGVRIAAGRVADAIASGRLAEKRGRATIKALRLALQAVETEHGTQRFEEAREELQEVREEIEADRASRRPWE